MTDRERVGEALKAVREGIRPVVVAAWESSYGADWPTRVNVEGRHQVAGSAPDDLGFLLDGMWNTWNAVFARKFGSKERNLVLELREESKRWARKETLSARDAAWVLESCEQLLIAFAAERQAAAVRSLKGDALRQPATSVPAAGAAAPVRETGSEAQPRPQPVQPEPRPTQPAQTRPAPGRAQTKGQPAGARQPRPTQLPSGRLAPYTAWPLAALPNLSEADRSVLMTHILSIVRAEGPVSADRVFTLMVKASGQSRVTAPVRHLLNRALFAAHGIAIRDFRNPLTRWPQRVIHSAGTEEVVVRQLGPRDLYEVPLDEIAALMDLLTSRPLDDPEHTKRRILDAYSLQRRTSRASAYLDAALALLPH